MGMCNPQQTFWDEYMKRIIPCSENCNGELEPFLENVCRTWCNGNYSHSHSIILIFSLTFNGTRHGNDHIG